MGNRRKARVREGQVEWVRLFTPSDLTTGLHESPGRVKVGRDCGETSSLAARIATPTNSVQIITADHHEVENFRPLLLHG